MLVVSPFHIFFDGKSGPPILVGPTQLLQRAPKSATGSQNNLVTSHLKKNDLKNEKKTFKVHPKVHRGILFS